MANASKTTRIYLLTRTGELAIPRAFGWSAAGLLAAQRVGLTNVLPTGVDDDGRRTEIPESFREEIAASHAAAGKVNSRIGSRWA